jgi:hypothetical protein
VYLSEYIHRRTERGFASVAQPLSFFAAGSAAIMPTLRRYFSRPLTRRLTERTGEIGLARKFEGQRNMDQRLVVLPEQLFGELKPQGIPSRRSDAPRPERPDPRGKCRDSPAPPPSCRESSETGDAFQSLIVTHLS